MWSAFLFPCKGRFSTFLYYLGIKIKHLQTKSPQETQINQNKKNHNSPPKTQQKTSTTPKPNRLPRKKPTHTFKKNLNKKTKKGKEKAQKSKATIRLAQTFYVLKDLIVCHIPRLSLLHRHPCIFLLQNKSHFMAGCYINSILPNLGKIRGGRGENNQDDFICLLHFSA